MRRRAPYSMLLAVMVMAGTLVPHAAVAQQAEADIEGKTWQLVTYQDGGGSVAQVPPGIGVDLLFFSGEAEGDGACSEYEKASYSLSGRTLQIFEPTIIARACDDEAQRVDEAFYDALFRTGTYAIEGAALLLLNPAGDTLATFTRGLVPADPTIAPWRLERIAGSDGSSGPVIQGSLPSVRFLPGGRVIGDSGCGSFLGSWQVRDLLMTISDVAFRHKNCTNELHDQADVILSTFDEIVEFTIRPAGLALEDGAGVTRLALVPDIRLAERNWAPTVVLDRNGDVSLDKERLHTASVRFSRARVSGRTPCPRDYRAENQRAGLAVTIFDPKTESGRCGPRSKLEKPFFQALKRVASHAQRGTELELLDVDGLPVMRLVAQPGLRDFPWAVVKYDTRPKSRISRLRAPGGKTVLMADFGESEVITGSTGLRTFNGFYEEPDGTTIDIQQLQRDESGCGGRRNRSKAICRLEASYLGLLSGVDGYEIDDGQLVLLKGNRASIILKPAVAGAS